MDFLHSFFDDRLISHGLWLPRSPDLAPNDFFLWGYIKEKVYVNHPRTLAELEANITKVIEEVPQTVLKRVFSNLVHRVECCIMSERGQFEFLM